MMNSNTPTRTTRRRCTSNNSSNNMALTIALLILTIASSPASSLTLVASPTSSSSSAPSRSFSSSSTAISATSTEAGISSTTCVPPPNSRLAQLLRHQQSQSLPGTKNKQSGRRSGQNLRYATYPAADSVEGTATVAPLFYHGHGEDEEEELMSSEFQSSSLKSDDELKKKKNTNTDNSSVEKNKKKDDHHHVQIQRRRKRVRMLRPFSTRLKKKATASSSQQQQLQQQQQQENKARLDEYEQRKAAWAAKYTSVSSLRTTFGTNKNKIFGDFDPFTTRRLYHTLLPRALLELRGLRDMMLDGTVKLSSSSSSKDDDDRTTTPLSTTNNNKNNDDTTNNVNNNNNNADLIIKQELKELAPLAYQARVAAKKYARERSRLPGRIGSMLYDGYRQWRRYGKWDNSGMSWDQVWAKYEDQVLGEVMEEMMLASSSSSSSSSSREVSDVEVEEEEEEDVELATTAATLFNNYGNDLDDEELTARICLRILERSVTTNEMVDKLFRRTEDKEDASASLDESTPLKRRRRYERQQRHKMRILNDLQAIEQKFDEDIQELLRYSKFTTEEGEERRRKRQKGAFFWKKPMLSSSASTSSDQANDDDDDEEVPSRVVDVTTSARGGTVDTINASVESSESNDVASALFSVADATTTNTTTPKKKKSPSRKLARHEIIALRILATTKQRIASLQATKED
eukprot:scaffold1789_cov102-Skeletonema_dohrnii-CCMP3373.AAC.3